MRKNFDKARSGTLEEVTALRQYAMRADNQELLGICNDRLKELKRIRTVTNTIKPTAGESQRSLRKRRRAAIGS